MLFQIFFFIIYRYLLNHNLSTGDSHLWQPSILFWIIYFQVQRCWLFSSSHFSLAVFSSNISWLTAMALNGNWFAIWVNTFFTWKRILSIYFRLYFASKNKPISSILFSLICIDTHNAKFKNMYYHIRYKLKNNLNL